MKFLIREEGKKREYERVPNVFKDKVVQIIFDNVAEFNEYNWPVCPYKATLENITIADSNPEKLSGMRQVGRIDIQHVPDEPSEFAKLTEIDLGNSVYLTRDGLTSLSGNFEIDFQGVNGARINMTRCAVSEELEILQWRAPVEEEFDTPDDSSTGSFVLEPSSGSDDGDDSSNGIYEKDSLGDEFGLNFDDDLSSISADEDADKDADEDADEDDYEVDYESDDDIYDDIYDEAQVRVTGKSGLSSTVLDDPDPVARAEYSGNLIKVESLINNIKIYSNESLRVLTIHNADLSTIDFADIDLPALETLDLRGSTIPFDSLKQLTQNVGNKPISLYAQNMTIVIDSRISDKELKKFFQKFSLRDARPELLCNNVAESIPAQKQPDATKPQVVQSAPSRDQATNPHKYILKTTPTSTQQQRTTKRQVKFQLNGTNPDTAAMPVSFELMNAVKELYENKIPKNPSSSSLQVTTDVNTNTAILMDGGEKLIQSTGREVIAFSKLTKDQSIELRLKAMMILKGLGVPIVDPNDIKEDTKLPNVADLVFGARNNNPALTKEITDLLRELIEARDNLATLQITCNH